MRFVTSLVILRLSLSDFIHPIYIYIYLLTFNVLSHQCLQSPFSPPPFSPPQYPYNSNLSPTYFWDPFSTTMISTEGIPNNAICRQLGHNTIHRHATEVNDSPGYGMFRHVWCTNTRTSRRSVWLGVNHLCQAPLWWRSGFRTCSCQILYNLYRGIASYLLQVWSHRSS